MTLCFLGIKQFSGKMYRKSRIWKCSLNDKGDHLCQQILWLPEFKKKNEGARKRNDELRPMSQLNMLGWRYATCHYMIWLYSQAFIQALLPIAVFPQRFSFFTVCLVYYLREVSPMKGIELMSLDHRKIHFQHSF